MQSVTTVKRKFVKSLRAKKQAPMLDHSKTASAYDGKGSG